MKLNKGSLFALFAVLVCLLAACGGSEAERQGSPATQPEAQLPAWVKAVLDEVGGPDVAATMGSADFAVGENRVVFLVVREDGSLVQAPGARVRFGLPGDRPETVEAVLQPVGAPGRPQPGEGEPHGRGNQRAEQRDDDDLFVHDGALRGRPGGSYISSMTVKSLSLLATAVLGLACGGDKRPEAAQTGTPEVFRARFETSEGDFVIEVHREWAPLGAERFHRLVLDGYYDGTRFFRVISGFMAQFGIHGDPQVSARWRGAQIPDDPVRQSNARGMVSFATAGPGTRTTQAFINYRDNARLDGMGFAGAVVLRPVDRRTEVVSEPVYVDPDYARFWNGYYGFGWREPWPEGLCQTPATQ